MRRAIAFVIIHTLLRAIRPMPISWLHTMARWIAGSVSRPKSVKHKIVDANLAIAFDGLSAPKRAELQAESSLHTSCFAMETGLVWHGSSHQIDKAMIEISGWEHIDQAMSSQQGLLLVGAHLGNWELLNLYCMRRLQMAGLYKAPSDPVLNQWIKKARERFGGQLIASGSQTMRQVLRTLKAGGAAGIIADQQPKLGEGVMAPFFGRQALTMTLINRLARHTGCHVLMATCYRELGKGFRIEVFPIDKTIYDADPTVAATALNQAIEKAIRVAPAQYLWRYRRFPSDCYDF